MKQLFSFLIAIAASTYASAQMHGAMTFAGKADFFVTAGSSKMGETTIESDTIIYDGASNSFTLPRMTYGAMVIPSFTIVGATQTSAGYAGVTWGDTSFSCVTSEGKLITGTSLSGTFTHNDGIYELKLSITFNYGSMPMPITYNITAYYVKPTTKMVKVAVAGAEYTNESVTYDARLYREDERTMLDIAIQDYSLTGTVMGDIMLGAYTIRGVVYDESKKAYYRDYSQDGLSFHFVTSGGIDSDYTFSKNGNILVKMNGTNIDYAENNFQPGNMPFPICSKFGVDTSTGISCVETEADADAEGKMYNLNGTSVNGSYRGIVVKNGKKYVNK